MPRSPSDQLSRRERQIMEILYRRGRATIAEVQGDLPDPPTDAAVRAALLILEQKGQVRKAQDGPRNVFSPAVPREKAKRSALRQLLDTFFEGSREQAMTALLDGSDAPPSDEELERYARLIEELRGRRREA